jgi:thioester reductase-like protein
MIFIADVEVEALPDSKMAGHGVGASVYCLIPAESKRAAEQRLREALQEDRYRLVKTNLLQDYEGFRWESAHDQSQYDRLAKRAALKDDIVYGESYTWSRDD